MNTYNPQNMPESQKRELRNMRLNDVYDQSRKKARLERLDGDMVVALEIYNKKPTELNKLEIERIQKLIEQTHRAAYKLI